ncbi:MAG: class I SAM-dependent methyltransferase [Nitrospira sp.]|nr:class I SAM-dependent methyltransferase [Nitrospira sp.]
MKLNAGSGEGTKGYGGDFVNLDLLRPHKGVQGDILNLPFKDNSFEEVRLIHVLEHVLRRQQVPMLRELHRVVKPGGVLYVEVPDFLENMVDMVRAYQSRPTDWEEIRIRTVGAFGKQRTPGDAHHWGYNIDFLTRQLLQFKWASVVRSTEMISGHWRVENVILMRCVK